MLVPAVPLLLGGVYADRLPVAVPALGRQGAQQPHLLQPAVQPADLLLLQLEAVLEMDHHAPILDLLRIHIHQSGEGAVHQDRRAHQDQEDQAQDPQLFSFVAHLCLLRPPAARQLRLQ